MSNRTVYENIDLLILTKNDIYSSLENKDVIISNETPFSDYSSLIYDISTSCEDKDWDYIGYDKKPEYIDDGFEYAKYMIKHKNEFSGISEHKLDVSNNSSLIYLPSCSKLGVDPNDISVLSFCNCRNLRYIADDYLNTLKVKFNASTFAGCVSLKYIPKLDISTYTTPVNLYGLFSDLYSLETIDPSNNTKYWYFANSGMYRLFYNCYNLKTLPVIDCEKLPTSYRNVSYMFYKCKALTDVSIINSSNVTNMSYMFYGCESLTTVPLFDTQNVSNMNTMFSNCYSLTTVPLFDTQNVSTMNAMFSGCTALTTVPLFDTQNVSTMNAMFSGCYSLTTVPLFDTQNVTDMLYMFLSCKSLTTIPQFDTQNVSTMNAMFLRATALTTVPELNTQNVINMSSIFTGCTALTTVEGLDFRSISSGSNSRIALDYASSLRKMYIKNIGYSACPTYDFTYVSVWGINNSSIPDASLSIYKSLVEDTSNRAAAGSSTVNIKLDNPVLNALNNSIKAAICAKGYTLNGTAY